MASPALLVTVLADTDVTDILSRNLAASAAGVLVAGLLYVGVARLPWRKGVGDTVVGTLCSVYVNAGNRPGGPGHGGQHPCGRPSFGATDGSLLGLVLSLTEVRLPRAVYDPLDLIGGMAVPAMLLSYGVSLRLGPRSASGTSPCSR